MIKRLTVRTGDGYSSTCCKRELAERLGILEDVLFKTGDQKEDQLRWQRFYDLTMGANKDD